MAGGIYVGLHSHLFTSRYAMAGAPGYETYSGPEHAPLAVGRPWGTRCQPIVFVVNAAVPDATYLRIADTITSARSLGVDVGIQAREGTWQPGLLYPPGLTNADVKFVDIYADDGTPPPLGNGKPEHIGFGWDTRYRGGHDAVTGMQATLYLRAVDDADGFLVRRSIRQLVAFSQGIFLARDPASGIADNSATDTFTIKDVHAMQVMSGCNP